MSENNITYIQFYQYIKPAMGKICNLTKFIEDNSYINEKAIIVYYNIIFTLNKGNYFYNNPELENEIGKYNFMYNFCEILKKYIIENNNKKISINIIKTIFKIINIIFKVSKKETEKLLSLNFLGIASEILHHEFNDVKNEDLNPVESNSILLTELLSVLIALFGENKVNNNSDFLIENKKKKKMIKN